MKKLLLFSLLMLTGFGMAKANIVTIGDGSGGTMSDALPTSARYEYSLTQQLYTGAEIGASGTINSIAFYKEYEGTVTRSLDIYMAQTDKTDFMGANDWAPVDESHKVFCGSVTFEADGWTTIPLAIPFEYWDKQNLVITIDDNTSDYSATKIYFRTMDATNASIFLHSEGTDYQPTTELSSYSGTIVSQKPQVQLDITPIGKNVVKVGGGTRTSSFLPATRDCRYGLTQQIYTKDELGKAGSIKSITFKTGNESWGTNAGGNNVDIYMVHTNKTYFADGLDWVEFSEADKVFSGYISHYYVNSFTKVTLNNSFEYNGIDNVALIVVQHNGAMVSGPYPECLSYAAPGQAISAYNNSTAYDPANLASYTGDVWNDKNQLWLDIVPSAAIGIGDTDFSGALPTNTSYPYSYSQQIYTSEEIGKSGYITSLSFYCINTAVDPSERTRNVDIYLAHTGVEYFYGSNSWQYIGEADKCFSGNITLEPDKWIKITLDKPFQYNGTSNLVVAFDDNTGTSISDFGSYSAGYFRTFTTSTRYSLYTYGNSDISIDFDGSDQFANRKNQVVIGFGETWQLGEGTDMTQMLPVDEWSDYFISQQIYTADEIDRDQADITSIAFYNAGSRDCRAKNLDVYITSPTETSPYEDGNSWLPVTADDMVFSGTVTFKRGMWTDIPLNRVFHYSRGGGGIHDLVITVVDKTDDYGGSGIAFLTYDAEGRAIYASSYYSAFTPEDMSGVEGTVLNMKNQIQFNNVAADIKPINVRATDINFTSAYIRWNAPSVPVLLWQLEYKAEDETVWTTFNVGADETSRLLTGLAPRKSYNVRLRLLDENNDFSNWSETEFNTDIMPTNVQIETTYQSATITWDGPGEMWDFQYKRDDESTWKGVTGLTEKTYSLTELEETTSYYIRVRVTDGNDNYGSWFETSFSTPERYPAPDDPNAISVSAYNAVLIWGEEGSATAWQICLDGDEEHLIDVNASNSKIDEYGMVTYILTGLEPNKVYIFKVRAVYPEDEAFSEWSYDSGFQTTDLNPAAYKVQVAANKNSATISWLGESDSYKLSYRKAAALFLESFENDMGSWTTVNLNSYSGIHYDNTFYFSYYSEYSAPGLQYLISPELNGIPNGAILSLRYHSWGVQTYFKVGYSTTTNDVGAFTWSGTFGSNDWDWYPYTQTLPAGVKYIAIQNMSDDINNKYASLYIDDITITVNGAEPGEWTTIETTDRQVKLTDLEANTPYEFQIVSITEGQPDATTEMMSFMTRTTFVAPEIAVTTTSTTADFSWTGDFDKYKLEYRTAEKEDVWQYEDIYFDETFEGDLYWMSYDLYVNSGIISNAGTNGSGGFRFETGGMYPQQYIMHGITDYIPEGTLLKFVYRGEHGYMGDGLSVGYSTTDYDLSNFTWTSIMDSEEVWDWKEYSLVLPEGVTYIAFQWAGVSGEVTIDDVRVAKYTYTSYVIPAGEWQELWTTENELQVTELDPGTTYDYLLTAIATDGSTVVSGIEQFTTPWSAIDIAVDAKGSNTGIIASYDGTYANVTIQNRTLSKNGQWQTLCLPFDVNVESSILAGADVRSFNDAKLYNAAGFVTLDFLTPVTKMRAGYPYIIRWESGADIENPVFEGVTVKNEVNVVTKGSTIDFIPNFDDYTDPWSFFYEVDGTPVLKRVQGEAERNAFECHFQVMGIYSADTYILNTGTEDDLITGVESIDSKQQTTEEIYNLAGQRLGKTQKGINIVNGRKVLVK